MAAKGDPNRRASRVAAAVLAGLFVFVLLANVLWPAAPSPSTGQARVPPTASPFPAFRMGPVLHVVPMEGEVNLSTHLLMTSLQGFVNRESVELYLDVGSVSANTSEMLSFLVARYNVTVDTLSLSAAIGTYAPRASGLIVYDPSRPESIDIGTMIAAQQGALLVGPDLAGWLHALYGLPIFDYALSDWAASDAIGAYDRALQDLLPSSSNTTLSILPPDRWAIRDYLIATRTFVFYLPQGALASPFETAATMRILHATPRGIPILGWFNSPTLTEENSFVQMASWEGKFVLGVQDVPNLSVLTALGRNETHRQVSSSSLATNVLENKTYVVLAVPDGDNIDFAAGRMRELWADPIRGTTPITWSLSPLLVDLAPPLIDVYYDDATPLDRFVAAPSGAGYLYPDFASPVDLPPFVAFSDRYLRAADMDVVWLLNAFRASETPYTSASLSAYVDGLRPEGIVLDYDDQPKTRDAWMQAGTQAVAPVVRSTHFWTTQDNVFGKLDAARSTWGRGPHFLWLTVYTFRFDLRDARDLVVALSARLDGNLEVVSPTEFFGLLEQDFVRDARESLAMTEGDPIAAILFGSSVESARARLQEADGYLAIGDAGRAANAAYLAEETLHSISSAEAITASLLVILAAAVVAILAQGSSRRASSPRDSFSPGAVLLVAASVALLVFALREAVEQNFWTYPTIVIGIASAGLHRPLSRALDRGYPDRAPVAATLVTLVFTALAIRTSAAFPLAVIGSLLAIESYLSRHPAGSAELLAGLAFGTSLGFLGGFDFLTFSALAGLLVLPSLGVRGPRADARPGRPPPALLVGFVLALPLSALAVGSYYAIALRLEVQGDILSTLAGGLLVLGPTLAILARRILPPLSPIRSEAAGLALAAAFGGLALISIGTIVTFLVLLGLFTSLSFSALSALDAHAARGGDPRRGLAVAVLLLPLFVLFFRMPPVVYSLTFVALPEGVEYALYQPLVVLAAIALVLAIVLSARTRFRSGVRKDYPGEVHGGAGRP